MRQKRLDREQDDEEAKQKRVRYVDGEEQEDYGDEDEDIDSDELMYDSEEEAAEDLEFAKRMARKENAAAQEGVCLEELKAPEKIEETADGVKALQKYKPVAGVKFTEYDELGLPKNDG